MDDTQSRLLAHFGSSSTTVRSAVQQALAAHSQDPFADNAPGPSGLQGQRDLLVERAAEALNQQPVLWRPQGGSNDVNATASDVYPYRQPQHVQPVGQAGAEYVQQSSAVVVSAAGPGAAAGIPAAAMQQPVSPSSSLPAQYRRVMQSVTNGSSSSLAAPSGERQHEAQHTTHTARAGEAEPQPSPARVPLPVARDGSRRAAASAAARAALASKPEHAGDSFWQRGSASSSQATAGRSIPSSPTQATAGTSNRPPESRQRTRAQPQRVSMEAIMRHSASPGSSPHTTQRVSLSARIAGPALAGQQAQQVQRQHAQRQASPATTSSRPVSARLYSPPGSRDQSPSASGVSRRSPRAKPQSRHPHGSQPAWAPAGTGSSGGSPAASPTATRPRSPTQPGVAGPSRSNSPTGSTGGHGQAASPQQVTSPLRSSQSFSELGQPVGWTEGGFVSHAATRLQERLVVRRSFDDHGTEFYRRFQVKQHRQEYADYQFSQPRKQMPMVTVSLQNISFDSAHPALADQHYMRKPEHEAMLSQEQLRLAKIKARREGREAQQSRSRTGSPMGPGSSSADDGAQPRDVVRRRRGWRSSQQWDQAMPDAAPDVLYQRAQEAISESQAISQQLRISRTPSPGRRGASARYGGSVFSGDRRTASSPGFRHNNQVEMQPPQLLQEEPLRQPHQAEEAHLVGERDSHVPVVRASGPALSELEFKMASAAFDAEKYEEYNRQMDLEMQQRAEQQGYDSDEERARQAEEVAALEAMTDEQRAALEQQQQENAQLHELLRATFEEQNSWMDYYRERLGPQEGYQDTSDGHPPAHLLTDMRSSGAGSYGAQRPTSPLSPADERLIENAFVPVTSTDLAADGYLSPRGYASDGPDGYQRPHRMQRPFTPTKPRPFHFEERAKTRPKSIMAVKGEQDLMLRAQEQQAAKSYRFKAKPVPGSNSPGRYEHAMLAAEVRRQINRDSRLEELQGMMERPFSFQDRDEARAHYRDQVAKAAKDPNRFQIPFYAKPIPGAVRERKFEYMMLELENKRRGARERMDAARALARKRVQDDMAVRQQQSDRVYQERLRAIDPIWNQKYDTKPLGAVPDFQQLHSQWECRLAKLRALRRPTVPKEFGTHNARNPHEKAARERKALERRQRILLDMALDSELLPEQRWPHMAPRGRVRPTPPPAYAQPTHQVSDTRANILRRAATQSARKAGKYAGVHEKEWAALDKARKDAQIRAAAYMRMKEACKAMKGDQDGADQNSTGTLPTSAAAAVNAGAASSEGGKEAAVNERRKALAGRTDAPILHIEARHAQAEKQARMEIESVLLDKGVYNDLMYTEG